MLPPLEAGAVKVTVAWASPPVAATDLGAPGSPSNVNVAVRVTPPKTAVIVTEVRAVTGVVATVNVALVVAAGTITDDGTVAAALLLLRLTEEPPPGAGPVSVTVPVELVPPATVVGFKLSVLRAGALTVSVAVRVVVPKRPVIVTEVDADTGDVVTVNVVLVLPAGTVTDAGTVAAALLLLRAISAPPTAAGPLRVTVPVELLPPSTLVGLRLIALKAGGFTVNVAVRVVEPKIAVIVAAVEAVTGTVVTVKVAVVFPADTVTDEGTAAAALLLLSAITAPPAGAAPFSVTVPVELAPPTTLVGLRLNAVKTAGVTVKAAVRVPPP